MAITVIGGLITSTALTLIVIPTIYSMLDGMVAWMTGSRREKRSTGIVGDAETGTVTQ